MMSAELELHLYINCECFVRAARRTCNAGKGAWLIQESYGLAAFLSKRKKKKEEKKERKIKRKRRCQGFNVHISHLHTCDYWLSVTWLWYHSRKLYSRVTENTSPNQACLLICAISRDRYPRQSKYERLLRVSFGNRSCQVTHSVVNTHTRQPYTNEMGFLTCKLRHREEPQRSVFNPK